MSKLLSPKNIIFLIVPIILVAAYFVFTPEKEDLSKLTVQEKKERFKRLILPPAQEVYADLMEEYNDVKKTIEDGDLDDLEDLKKEYRASNNEELLAALKPHPVSLTLAQAAMESSWATSRFFREGYNIFGVWSFDEDEPRMAAGEKRGDKTIWVRKYGSIEKSIRDYYRTLARGEAYKEFRKLKLQTNDSLALAKKLDRYSEKGAKYGEELISIIKFNKFKEHDS